MAIARPINVPYLRAARKMACLSELRSSAKGLSVMTAVFRVNVRRHVPTICPPTTIVDAN